MKHLYYTREGTPYILQSQTHNYGQVVFGAPVLENMTTQFNPPTNAGAAPGNHTNVDVVTPNKVIPVMYTLSSQFNGLGVTLVDISTPYFSAVYGGNTTQFQQKILAKVTSFVGLDFYTDEQNYNYNYRNDKVMFADSDFMDSQGLLLIWSSRLTRAMTGKGGGVTFNTGQQTIVVTVTYFELQK